MTRRLAILGIAVASSVFATLLRAENAPTDERARALAIEMVAKKTGNPQNGFNTKRMEDLEDDLFFPQRKIRGKIRKGAYFYRVDNGGYEITAEEAIYRPASAQSWYVAVSTLDGETFGLYGFQDATEAFERLVKKIALDINDAAKAEIFAKFYIQTVYHMRGNIVYDELWLRHQVEDHFVGYADSLEPTARKERRFHDWWNAFKSKKIGPLRPVTGPDGKGHYRVVMKLLEMTVGRPPELWEWSVEIQMDGAARLASKRPIFPTSPRSALYDLPAGSAEETRFAFLCGPSIIPR